MNKYYESILLDEAFQFIEKQEIKVRKKILQNIRRAEHHKDSQLFKKISNEIWEFRTLF